MPSWNISLPWNLVRHAWAKPKAASFGVSFPDGFDALPAPPFLLLSDHSTDFDAMAISLPFSRPIRFLANTAGVSGLKAFAASCLGAFSHRKGVHDVGSIRTMYRLADRGDCIGLFPEGDRSWDGSLGSFRPGLGKLAKRLGMPVVLARNSGNYLAFPRWAESPRKGSWEIRYETIGAGEISSSNAQAIDDRIAAALRKDDVKDCIRRGNRFTGSDVAAGVGRLLWQCPICEFPDSIRGSGDYVICDHCGSRWILDANLRLRPVNVPLGAGPGLPHDLKDWFDWQSGRLEDTVAAGAEDRMFSDPVTLSSREGKRWSAGTPGRLSFRDGLLMFESRDANYFFAREAIHGLVDNFNGHCVLYEGKREWKVVFHGGNAVKWIYLLGVLRRSGARQPASAGDSVA